jgi:hypothetical protein
MARWHGYTMDQTRKMLLTDFWLLDRFLLRHPPADLIVAAYLGIKTPSRSGSRRGIGSMRDAAKINAKALGQLPQRKKPGELPARLRNPETLAIMERMKAEWATTTSSE